MQKRGEIKLTYDVLIELILLIAITIAFFSFHKTVQEDTVFEKTYVARDIALLMETSQSVPGDITAYYSQPEFDVGKYNYDFSDNLFKVYEENVLSSFYYPYYLDKTLTAPLPALEHPAAFVITKLHTVFEIKEFGSITQKNLALTCPEYASTKKQKLSMAVAADADTAQLQTYLLGNSLLSFAKTYKEPTEETNLVIIFLSQPGKIIQAYYPTSDDGQSEKMACILANAIFNSITTKIPDAAVEYPQQSNDEMLRINPEGIAVQIVIGNDLLTESATVKSALKTGLGEYYE
jgi:hypothetical protein